MAVDLLGHGDSSSQNYDGLKEIQPPLQVEALHSLICLLRHGLINAPQRVWSNLLPYQFPRIVYVGHGYGSDLGAYLAEKYPKDVDAVVHTSPIGKGEFNSSVMRNCCLPGWSIPRDLSNCR